MKYATYIFVNYYTILFCYVDELLVVAITERDIQLLKMNFTHNFIMKDLGEPAYFLGIELYQTANAMCFDQEMLITKLLKEAMMSDSNPAKSPMVNGLEGDKDGEPSTLNNVERSLYHGIEGSLLQLAIQTRPNLFVRAGVLGSHIAKPNKRGWIAFKGVLRYLNKTNNIELILASDDENQIDTFAVPTRDHSMTQIVEVGTRVLVMYRISMIFATSKMQMSVALSSSEAQYNALAKFTTSLVWLRRVVEESGIVQDKTVIVQNNSGSIKWAMGDHRSPSNKRNILTLG